MFEASAHDALGALTHSSDPRSRATRSAATLLKAERVPELPWYDICLRDAFRKRPCGERYAR